MMISSFDFDECVRAIYQAATDRISWNSAMATVAKSTQAWAAQMIGVSKLNGQVLFSYEGGDASAESALDYIRHYHRFNPRIAPALALGANEWFHDHEVFDDEFVANDIFYRDFLIPYGGRYLSGTKIVDDDAQLILFGAMRGRDSRPFDGDERVYLDRLKAYLVDAFQLQSALRQERAEMQVGVALLNQFSRPMVLIDGQRSVVARNASAKQAFADQEYICERAGRLYCIQRGQDEQFSVALHELRLGHPINLDAPAPDRRFVPLSTRLDVPVGMYLVALRSQATMGSFGAEDRALAFFHDPRLSPGIDPFIVAETFGLTPAEARVAVSIAQGHKVVEIAEQHHVSVATVRTQLRNVLAKTQTERQADLVRVLAGMPTMRN